MEDERVKRTSTNNKKMLFKMNNFRSRPHTERNWNLRTTPIDIPLKSCTELPDSRLQKIQKKKRENPKKVHNNTSSKRPRKYLEETTLLDTEKESVTISLEVTSLIERMKEIATEIAKEINCEIPALPHSDTSKNQVDSEDVKADTKATKLGTPTPISADFLEERRHIKIQ